MKTVEVRGANELIKDLAKRSTDSTLRIVKKTVTLAYSYIHVSSLFTMMWMLINIIRTPTVLTPRKSPSKLWLGLDE